MAKSVELLKEALGSEEKSLEKYETALQAMSHEDSKKTVQSIIQSKKESISAVQEILEKSSHCPAVQES